MRSLGILCCLAGLGAPVWLGASATFAAEVLVEAESFANRGGWKLDTQFIQQMGSPYVLAHGLGQPVTDATTTVLPGVLKALVAIVRKFDPTRKD